MSIRSRSPANRKLLETNSHLSFSDDAQIIAMSATIGNLNEIGKFLNAYVYTHDFRPVELIQFVKCEDSVYRIVYDAKGNCYLAFERTLNFNVSFESSSIYYDPDITFTILTFLTVFR